MNETEANALVLQIERFWHARGSPESARLHSLFDRLTTTKKADGSSGAISPAWSGASWFR